MMHTSTFEYLKPTAEQTTDMATLRAAAKIYAGVLDEVLVDGPDKSFVMRNHRTNAMWANVAVTRKADGTPRE